MTVDKTPEPQRADEAGAPEDRERAAARRRGAGVHDARRQRPRLRHLPDGRRRRHHVLGRGRAAHHARLIKWWTRDEVEGGHLRMLYPPGGSDDGTAEAHLQTAAERGEYTGEGQRVRADGSTFWAGITITALRDEDGVLLGFAKVTRDLTARRAADALLQGAAESAEVARAEAVAASVAKSGFLATMSHEIRTPVNAILGYHELLDLEIEGPLTPGQRKYLARAGASARHLLALITDALGLVAPQARARHRDRRLGERLRGRARGAGDEARVRQILVNLLANSVKFTGPRNGGPGRITVSAGAATQATPGVDLAGDGPWVYVRVEDSGAGIPADRL